MLDDKQTSVTGTEVEDMTPDYLAAINELKQNSVDRSEYDKLKAENKKLINAVVNGQQIESNQGTTYRPINEIREEFDDNHLDNNINDDFTFTSDDGGEF